MREKTVAATSTPADVADRSPLSAATFARNLAPYTLLALLAVVFFYPVLFQDKVFLPADVLHRMQPWRSMNLPHAERPHNPILDPIQQYLPWRKSASDSLHQGILPLWNPYYFAGVPFLANNQSALLYPPNILFWTLPVEKAFGYAASLHFFLAGLFMFLFLRYLRLARLPSLLGAVVYMLSGFFVAWMQFPTFASAAVWLPLLLLLTGKAIGNWRFAVPAGFTLGLQFLGGHLQISIYVFLGFLSFALFQILCAGNPQPATRNSRLSSLAILSLISVLGIGIGCAQFLPTLEYSNYNFPKGGSYDEIVRHAYSPLEALLFFIPNLFGNPVDYNDSVIRGLLSGVWQHEFRTYIEACNYVGICTLLLAPFAFFNPNRKPRRLAFFFLWLAIFSLLAAFPTPICRLLYHLAPGFRQLAAVTRAVCLWDFALAALAALALHSLLTSPKTMGRTISYYSLCSFLILGLLSLLSYSLTSFPTYQGPILSQIRPYCSSQVLRFLVFSLASLALVVAIALRPGRHLALALLLVLLADLFPFARRFAGMVDPEVLRTTPTSLRICQEEPQFRFASVGPNFLNRLPPNLPSAFALKDIQGTDSFCPRWYWQVLSRIREGDESGLSNGYASPFLNLLSVRFILASPAFPLPPSFPLLAHPEASVYLNPRALPRARWLPEALVSSPQEALEAISTGRVDPLTTVLLSNANHLQPTAANSQSPSPNSDVAILLDSPNEVIIRVSAPNAGFVSLSDNFFPGWHAYLDAAPTPVFLANASFRAVEVPAGEHLLRFAFIPHSFKMGFFALLFSLFAGAGLLVYAWLTRRHGEIQEPTGPNTGHP